MLEQSDDLIGNHRCAWCGTVLNDIFYTGARKEPDTFCNVACFQNRLDYIDVEGEKYEEGRSFRVRYQTHDLITYTEPMAVKEALALAHKLRKMGLVARVLSEEVYDELKD